MIFKVLSLFLLLVFIGCMDNTKKMKYINENQGSTFKLLYPKLECRVVIDLSENQKQIKSMYSTCLKNKLLKDAILDFNNLIQYYELEILFKKSKNISLTFIQDNINFPNFIRYYNTQSKEIESILKYDSEEEINSISSEHLKKLGMAIEKSNLYNNAIQQLGVKECTKSLDFSLWLKNGDLATFPKSINRVLIDKTIIEQNSTNYQEYPHIEYLPVNIKCNK